MAKELDPTTEAVITGDQAHLAHLADAYGWERRGLLQRLSRTESLINEASTRVLRPR